MMRRVDFQFVGRVGVGGGGGEGQITAHKIMGKMLRRKPSSTNFSSLYGFVSAATHFTPRLH